MNQEETAEKWVLHLYVAGMTPSAKRALSNISTMCEERLKGRYSLDVIDLFERPALAEGDQIFAVPTLVRQVPPPLRKVIGDLASLEKLLVVLDLQAA